MLLGAGEVVPGPTVTLAPGGLVVGSITAPQGMSLDEESFNVWAERADGVITRYGRATERSGPAASYRIPGLDTGTWTIHLETSSGKFATVTADVEAPEGEIVTGPPLALTTAGWVTGTVRLPDDVVDPWFLRIRAQDATGHTHSGDVTEVDGTDASYRIRGLTTGRYTVTVHDAVGEYHPATAEIDVVAGRQSHAVALSLHAKWGQLNSKVTALDGRAFDLWGLDYQVQERPDAAVLLREHDGERTYRIVGLPTGRYTVAVSDQAEEFEATTFGIDVVDGEAAAKDLVLCREGSLGPTRPRPRRPPPGTGGPS